MKFIIQDIVRCLLLVYRMMFFRYIQMSNQIDVAIIKLKRIVQPESREDLSKSHEIWKDFILVDACIERRKY